ncbi:hypothetical protein [Flavobacterium sp.]|uniref:hypothetical protein n=1 Tax=Flavobacterium sp. TaxID=239 RepID=UPI002FDB1463
MKKIVLALVVLSFIKVSAQEETQPKDTVCSSKVVVNMRLGFSVLANNSFNLNQKLKSQNLTELNETLPAFMLGFEFFGEKMSGDLEFGFIYANPDKNSVEVLQRGFDTRARVHYNVVNQEKFAFTTGLSLAFTGNDIDIYSKSNTIDLNNLNPETNSGHISIRNQMFYAGPSVSVYLFRKSFPIRLNAGYEFALTRGRYKSDFGSVINNINENGNNRLVFGLVF